MTTKTTSVTYTPVGAIVLSSPTNTSSNVSYNGITTQNTSQSIYANIAGTSYDTSVTASTVPTQLNIAAINQSGYTNNLELVATSTGVQTEYTTSNVNTNLTQQSTSIGIFDTKYTASAAHSNISATVSIQTTTGLYSPTDIALNVNDTTNSEGILGLYKGTTSIINVASNLLKLSSKLLASATSTTSAIATKSIDKGNNSSVIPQSNIRFNNAIIRSSGGNTNSVKLLDFNKSPISSSITSTSVISNKNIGVVSSSANSIISGISSKDINAVTLDTFTGTSTLLKSVVSTKDSSATAASQKLILASILQNSSIGTTSTAIKSILPIYYSNANSSSAIRSIDTSPIFLSLAYPTDDVLGEANIDDDQSAWVEKLLLDTNATNSLISSIASNLLKASSATANSVKLVSFTKEPIQDSAVSGFSILNHPKPVLNSTSSTSSAIFGFNTSILPSSAPTAQFSILFNIGNIEVSTSSATFSILNNVGKLLTSNANTQFVLAFNNSIVRSSSSIGVSTPLISFVKEPISSTVTSNSAISSKTINPVVFSSNATSSTTLKTTYILRSSTGTTNSALLNSVGKVTSSSTATTFYIAKSPDKLASDTSSLQETKQAFIHNYFADLSYTQDITYVGSPYTI